MRLVVVKQLVAYMESFSPRVFQQIKAQIDLDAIHQFPHYSTTLPMGITPLQTSTVPKTARNMPAATMNGSPM